MVAFFFLQYSSTLLLLVLTWSFKPRGEGGYTSLHAMLLTEQEISDREQKRGEKKTEERGWEIE